MLQGLQARHGAARFPKHRIAALEVLSVRSSPDNGTLARRTLWLLPRRHGP